MLSSIIIPFLPYCRTATRRASPPRDHLHQQQQQQQQQQRERDYSFDQAEQNQSDAEEGSVRMGTRGPQNSNNNTNNTAVVDTVKEKQKKKGLKGLSKLFKRSKKDKEHKTGGDSDELSESEEEIYQTQQNAHVNGGKATFFRFPFAVANVLQFVLFLVYHLSQSVSVDSAASC